jgi:hypothetical protein
MRRSSKYLLRAAHRSAPLRSAYRCAPVAHV